MLNLRKKEKKIKKEREVIEYKPSEVLSSLEINFAFQSTVTNQIHYGKGV